MAFYSPYKQVQKMQLPILPTQHSIKELIDKKIIEFNTETHHSLPKTIPIVYSDKYTGPRPQEHMLLGSIVQFSTAVEPALTSSINTADSSNISEKPLAKTLEINIARNPDTTKVQDANRSEGNEGFQNSKVFVNINDPWCLIAVGIQGAGKSHTLMRLIESCSMSQPNNLLSTPMTSLICHYDPDLNNYCEAATLSYYPNSNIHVIVPPDVYLERKRFYSSLPGAKIHPLLFQFKHLSIEHIRKLMTVDAGENILYMHVLKNTLRKYQKDGNQLISIRELENDLIRKEVLQKHQLVPLKQRILLLQSLLAEEEENASIKQAAIKEGTYIEDIRDLFLQKGAILILDLSNPLMDQSEVCGVFNILVDMFVHHRVEHGKLLCFDEAHKFLNKSNELAQTIVLSARELRHHGLRLLVSTQNPDVLPDELMELSSLAVLHQTFSPRWIKFLKLRFPLSEHLANRLESLSVGQAVIYSPRAAIHSPFVGSECSLIQVSNRKYSSSGSKLNKC